MGTEGRRVLIVTYEFPPTGGAGVQRVAKLAKYLPENGWTPVVLAAKHVVGRPIDETLAVEVGNVRVIRTPARPVNRAISSLLGAARSVRAALRRRRNATAEGGSAVLRQAQHTAQTGRAGRTEALTRLLSMPDFAFLWIGPAVRAGVVLGRQERVEVVVASAPPFSALIAGMRIARRLGVPFVADFRDAWRDNPGHSWYPSPWHRRRSLALERKVLAASTAVTTAHPIDGEIIEMGGPMPVVIPNGFDRSDLPEWAPSEGDAFTLTFMGTFYSVNGPLPVLEAIKAARVGEAGPPRDIRLRIIGTWPEYVPALVVELGLQESVELVSYLPHHEALALLAASDAGVVVYADLPALRASTPAKLYEYLGIGLPVLFVGPTEGVAPDLVRRAGAGEVVSYSDVPAIAHAIASLAEMKASGELGVSLRPDVVDAYDRRRQAKRMSEVLDTVVGHTSSSEHHG